MSTFTFTDRNDAIRQIEDRLGSEGSREIAERMYGEANANGWAATNDEDVPTFGVTQKQWDSLLENAADA